MRRSCRHPMDRVSGPRNADRSGPPWASRGMRRGSGRALGTLAPRLAAIGLLISITGLWASMAGAEDPAVIVTPGSGRAFRAAIQVFRDDAIPVDDRRAAELRRMVGEGMEFSGVLLPLPDKAFLGEQKTTELGSRRRFDCEDWTQSGADALVEGVISTRGQKLSVEYQVWDTARCKRLVSATLQRPAKDMVRLAKLLSDAVVGAFTGTPGVAGTEIAFVSDRSSQREIYVMDADGGRQRAATRGASIKAFPDWTPDGKAILYTSYRPKGLPGLYITSRGEYRPGPILTRILKGLPQYRGVFGPDGKFLALVTSLDGAAEIFRVDRSGKDLRRLTRSGGIDISPSWSPDGEQIVFVSDRSGSPQLYIMSRDGAELRRLTFNGSYNTGPTWSPDGRWIVYETRIESQFDLWLIDPTGEVNMPLVAHRRSDEAASWSPDSRKVAFSSTRRGRADIYIVDIDGENLRRLTNDHGENLQPAWGPFAD
jgi:TolB protein